MAEIFKVLGQVDPLAATLTTLYTVPGARSAVVSTISVCNRSATPTKFRIAVRPAGAAIDPKHYVAYDAELLANEVWGFTLGIKLATTDVISVYAQDATISFNAFGQEIS